jgi:hypothetical protein
MACQCPSDQSFSSNFSNISSTPTETSEEASHGIEFVPRFESIQCNHLPKEALRVRELRYYKGNPVVVTTHGHFVMHRHARDNWARLSFRCHCDFFTYKFEAAAHHVRKCAKLLAVCQSELKLRDFFYGPKCDLDTLNDDPIEHREKELDGWTAQFGITDALRDCVKRLTPSGIEVTTESVEWDFERMLKSLASLAVMGYGVKSLVEAKTWHEAALALGTLGLGVAVSDIMALVPTMIMKITPTWYAQGPAIKPWIPAMVSIVIAYAIAGTNGITEISKGNFWEQPSWRTFAVANSALGPLVKGVFVSVWEFLTGIPWETDMDILATDTDLTEMYNEVAAIEKGEVYQHINSSVQACDRILNLETRMFDYKRRHTRRTTSDRVCVVADDLDRKIREWVKAVHASGKARGRFRVPPLVVRFVGKSNCGKSSLTPLIAARILSGKIELPEGASFSSQIYTRSTGNEFWGGYNHQPCVVYDDWGQKVDTASNPCPDFMEMITAANSAPWNVPMADVESKARTYFRSSLVILSSNAKQPAIKSVNTAEAVMRRIDIEVDVERVRPIDSEKLKKGLVDTSCYSFMVSPLASGEVGNTRLPPKEMSWEELVELCRAAYDCKLNAHTSQAEQIEEAFQGKAQSSFDFAREIADNFMQMVKEKGDGAFGLLGTWMKQAIAKVTAMSRPIPPVLHLLVCQEVQDTIDFLVDEGICEYVSEPIAIVFPGQDNVFDRYYKSDVSFTGAMHAEAAERGDEVLLQEFISGQTGYKLHPIGDPHIGKVTVSYPERSIVGKVFQESLGKLFGGFKSVVDLVKAEPFIALWLGFIVTMLAITFTIDYYFPPAPGPKLICVNGVYYWVDPEQFSQEYYDGESHIPKPNGKTQVHAVKGFLRPDTAQAAVDTVAYDCSPGWRKSVYPIRIQEKRVGYFFVVSGRIAILPAHIVNFYRSTPELTIDTIYQGKLVSMKLDKMKVYLADQDLAVIELPKEFHHHRNFLNQFPKHGDVTFDSGTVRLVKTEEEHHGFFEIHNRKSQYTDTTLGTTVTLFNTLRYAIPTVNGDCGALITHNVPSVNSKFLGFHVAGSNNRGLGRIVYREELQDIMAEFTSAEVAQAQSLAPEEVIKVKSELDSRFKVLKDDAKPVNMPSKTKIKKSQLHGAFEATKGISVLTPVGGFHPLIAGVNKYAEALPVSQEEWHPSRELVAQKMMTEGKAKVLSNEEALASFENLEAVDLKKSAGVPWLHQAPKSTKDQWVSDGSPKPELAAEIIAMEEAALAGKRRMHVYLDCLKDEKRALDKCDRSKPDKIKTRVFAVAPFEVVLLMRKYCGAFISHTIEDRITNTLTAGVNPMSLEWAQCVNYLREAGDNFFDGDWSGYDTRLPSSLIYEVFWHIEQWYREFDPHWTEEHEKIRMYVAREIAESRHQIGSQIIQWHGGLPSGCPGTNQIDSIANLIIFTRAMQVKGLSDTTILNETRTLFHGDDNLISVSDRVAERFTPKDVSNYGSSVGMVFTAANKIDDINGYKRLEDCQFLKRSFVPEGSFVWAPIDIEVPRDSIQWTKANESDTLSFPTALAAALEEWVVIGTPQAKKDLDHVLKLARKKGLRPLAPRRDELKTRYLAGAIPNLEVGLTTPSL